MPMIAAAPSTPSAPRLIAEAITRLDWAHETAGAMSDIGNVDADMLEAAARDARSAARLLGLVDFASTNHDVVAAARHASTASEAFSTAFAAYRGDLPEPDRALKVETQGELAERALHNAYEALGTDRD